MIEPVSAILLIAVLVGIMIWLDYRSFESAKEEVAAEEIPTELPEEAPSP